MVCSDHTTRVYVPEPFWLINERHLALELEEVRQHMSLMRTAGVSLAMCVIRNLLRCNQAACRAKPADRLSDSNASLLSPTQVQGLRAALYFLRLHSDGMLRAERDE